MPQRCTIHITTGDGGQFDLTPYATACSWEHGPSGPRALTLSAPRALAQAMALYDVQGPPPDVEARRGGRTVWRGRLASAPLITGQDGSTIRLRAEGYAAALTDIRHTALWSSTSVAAWAPADPTAGAGVSNVVNGRFALDTNNRLFVAPKKGDLFGATANPTGGTAVGGLVLMRPAASSRALEYVSFNYAVVGAGWVADLIKLNDNFTIPGTPTIWGQAGTGSGTFSGVIAGGCAGMILRFSFPGVNALFAGETETFFVTLTSLRINGDNAATITAGTIARALRAEIAAVNPGQLSSDISQIVDPGLDLTDVAYEDATALDILTALAAKGDGVGTIYDAGVDGDRRLFLRPRGSGARSWLVTVSALELERARDSVQNRVYARYQDASSRTLRTATVTSAASVARYGLTRDGVVNADTTSLAVAQAIRAVAAADRADPQPTAAIAVERIADPAGGIVTGDVPLPGDTLIIQNLAASQGAGTDRVRAFRLSETRYDAMTGEASYTPEAPLPTLEVLLAQAGRTVAV